MKESLAERLKILRNQLNKTQKEFCNDVGITQGAYSQLEKGTTNISLDTLISISNAFNVNCNWLINGVDEMFNSNMKNAISHVDEKMQGSMQGFMQGLPEKQIQKGSIYDEIPMHIPSVNEPFQALKENSNQIEPQNNDNKGIPLIPIDALAGWGGADFSVLEKDLTYYNIPEFSGVDFLIRVKGSSMYPKYSSGDIVACIYIKNSQFIQWGKVYVLDTTQGPLVKRIFPSTETNCLECRSDNQSYPPFNINKQEIRAIALVVGVIRLE